MPPFSPKQSRSRTGKPGVSSSVLCGIEVLPEPGAPFFEQKSPCYPCPLDHQQCDCPRPELKTFWCSQNLLLPCSGSNMGCSQTAIPGVVQIFCRNCFLAAPGPACCCGMSPLRPSLQGHSAEAEGPSPSCCPPCPLSSCCPYHSPTATALPLGATTRDKHFPAFYWSQN